MPVAGWYHPGAAVGIAAVVGGLAGAAAAASVSHYAQPPTAVSNYYNY